MIGSHYLAGVVAGLPVSLLCLAYVLLRRDVVVAVFSGGERPMPEQAAPALAFGAAIFIGPVLGLAAAFVFDRVGSEQQYVALAFGLATLMSIVALVSRTPLMVEKIVLNFAVAAALGLLMPGLIPG
jgi:low temperature requirement protein LtrA